MSTLWTDGNGYFYSGDKRPGDRAASDAEVAAWSAAHPSMPGSVAVVSAGTTALSGTYAIDPDTRAEMAEIVTYIIQHSAFPAGLSALPWADSSGAYHSFATPAAFVGFATAIADYVTAVRLGSSPVTPLNIA